MFAKFQENSSYSVFSPPDSPLGDTMYNNIKKYLYWKNTHSSISARAWMIRTTASVDIVFGWLLIPQFFVWRIQTYWAQCPFLIGPRNREIARCPVRHPILDMVSTFLDMAVAILFLVGTPKLKQIVRVEHVKGDNQVRVLAPVLIHHLLHVPQALVQKHQIINPRARVRSPQN